MEEDKGRGVRHPSRENIFNSGSKKAVTTRSGWSASVGELDFYIRSNQKSEDERSYWLKVDVWT